MTRTPSIRNRRSIDPEAEEDAGPRNHFDVDDGVGIMICLVGIAFAVMMYQDKVTNWMSYAAAAAVSGVGLYYVNPHRARGAVSLGGSVADRLPLRRSTDWAQPPMQVQAPANASVIVDRPEASTVVVPPYSAPVQVTPAEVPADERLRAGRRPVATIQPSPVPEYPPEES